MLKFLAAEKFLLVLIWCPFFIFIRSLTQQNIVQENIFQEAFNISDE